MDVGDHERWWQERGARELRELLYAEWDPIGVKELVEGAEDEYDAYAGQLARRLRAGSSDEEVAALLEGFRADMGLEPDPDGSLAVGRRIREWYRESRST